MFRRRIVALLAVLAVAPACVGTPRRAASSDGSIVPIPTTVPPPATVAATTAPTRPPVAGDPYSRPGWVAAENQRPGTSDWRIVGPADPVHDLPGGWIEGYADTTSAQFGQVVTLFVDTPAEQFVVSAYRMGWYDGDRGRLVWRSDVVPGGRQPAATYDGGTGMAEAPWRPSLQFTVTVDWPPGAYLLKLESSGLGAHYVPLTVRDDAAYGPLLFMSAVTTWQAYNPWGGCTLYECFEPRTKFRAEVVSFDRPYAWSYAQGAADFPTHELPLIAFIEEQGYDTAYITNIDLHREPSLASSRATLVSPGHDEYYSWTMRDALVQALDGGTNLAFFGANAVYRNIRLEPGAGGGGERRLVNYRRADPGAGGDPHRVTVNFREPPLRLPEAQIVGVQYGCAEVRSDLRLVNTGSWFFEGTGAFDGMRIDNLVGVEFDELAPGSQTPPGLEVLAASPLECRLLTYQQATAYHTRASGAGVFAAGTIDWGCGLDGTCAGIPRSDVVRGVTANVLRVFAAGPAGLTHPSRGNAGRYRIPVHEPTTPVSIPRRATTTTTGPADTTPGTDPPPTTAAPPPTDPPPATTGGG